MQRAEHGAWTVDSFSMDSVEDEKMTVQDLLELLQTLPEEARLITIVECPVDDYDSMMGFLTRRGVKFSENCSDWTLRLEGDNYAKERSE